MNLDAFRPLRHEVWRIGWGLYRIKSVYKGLLDSPAAVAQRPIGGCSVTAYEGPGRREDPVETARVEPLNSFGPAVPVRCLRCGYRLSHCDCNWPRERRGR
jgi:hypothetical protein